MLLYVSCILTFLLNHYYVLADENQADCLQLADRFCKNARISKYRTFDGTCNNIVKDDPFRTKWGSSGRCYYYRFTDPEYADYWGKEIRKAKDGKDLPNARHVSNVIGTQRFKNKSPLYSQALTNWGQVLGNEMTYIGNMFGIYLVDEQTPCCKIPAKLKGKPLFPDCRPIPISPNDPFYSKFNFTCFNYVRSPECTNCWYTPRVQMQMRTAFIDGGTIYSNTINDTYMLRAFVGGRLRRGKSNLQIDQGKKEFSSCGINYRDYYPNEKHLSCFKSGDPYTNNTPFKAALVQVLFRQHNRLAAMLQSVNPDWNDQQLFLEARRILGAQMEMITYNEYLPIFFGPEGMEKYHLSVKESGYTGYDENLNPSIAIEFASIAMRSAGHSMTTGDTYRLTFDGKKEPWDLSNFYVIRGFHQGKMDSYLKGEVSFPIEQPDLMYPDVIRNNAEKIAFNGPGHGADLLTVDIMRGRDQGIASYKTIRKICSNDTITSFNDLRKFMSDDTVNVIQSVYKVVDDVDLTIGLLGEFTNEKNTKVLLGPTNQCLWGIQFFRTKYGDRYYFEHADQTGSFTQDQLQAIRKGTYLSKLICENGDNYSKHKIQKYAMKLPSVENPEVPCSSIPDLDISPWAGTTAQTLAAEGVPGLKFSQLFP